MDRIVKVVEMAARLPGSVKNIYRYEKGEKFVYPLRGRWVFPQIQSTRAWETVKQILGKEYYPHFLRLNRLGFIATDPTTGFQRLKSFSGIKSVKSLSAYLGQSKEEQKKALDFMDAEYGRKKI